MFRKTDRNLLASIHDHILLWSGRIERVEKHVEVERQRVRDDRVEWLAERVQSQREVAENKAYNDTIKLRNEAAMTRCDKLNDELEKLIAEMRAFIGKRKA